MKYIKILPVWLCVLCLTGCCETENEIGATTEIVKVKQKEQRCRKHMQMNQNMKKLYK